MTSPNTAYDALIAKGEIAADPAQAVAVGRLDMLSTALEDHARGRSRGLLGFARKRPAPRGLYLWGPVGRGKSMLMDLFFETVPLPAKRRVHFHAFMAETHEAIRVQRTETPGDPIVPVAKRIARAARLLCFDEFQVTDIADAMLLGRLFETLFEEGVTVVATSNRPPADLYKDGINRQLFLPFIDMLEQKLDVLAIAGPTDYRLGRIKGLPVYLTPDDGKAAQALDAAWAHLTDNADGRPEELHLLGRTLTLPRFAHGVARATFQDLCAQPLGPQDMLAIAAAAHTLILEHIPLLTPARRNEAKRFVTLIDALYEAKGRLICSAAAPPERLYPEGDGAFEFDRTVSRLMEMQSAGWLQG
ncbi:MAG: cell division protein ZapE [Micropepsaceae bacterium]